MSSLETMQSRYEWRIHNLRTDLDLIDKKYHRDYILILQLFLKLLEKEVISNARLAK